MMKRKSVKYFSVALMVMLVCLFNVYSITSGMTTRNVRILGKSTPTMILEKNNSAGRPVLPLATGVVNTAVAEAVFLLVAFVVVAIGFYQAGQVATAEEIVNQDHQFKSPLSSMLKATRSAMLMADLK